MLTKLAIAILAAGCGMGILANNRPTTSHNLVDNQVKIAPLSLETARDRGKTFVVDPEHSAVLFRVQHLGAGPFWGRFNEISGQFKLDPKSNNDNFVKIEIKVASVDSNSRGRDAHLRKQDFFAAKEFPTITFESSKVTRKGDNFEIKGTLTMRGVKKSVTTMAKHFGTKSMIPNFGLRSGYEAELSLKRGDFGINYGIDNGMLGNDIRVIIAIEGMIAK